MADCGVNKLSITFPESVLMPTKKGRQDFTFKFKKSLSITKIVLTPFYPIYLMINTV